MPVCDVYKLQALVDGQLGEAEAAVVSAHVAGCPSCARVLDGLRFVVGACRLTPEPAPAGLHERLLAAVAGVRPVASLDCVTALEFVSLRLDGELSLDDGQRLDAHLEACAGCARAASELELTSGLLRAIQPEAAPLGLLQRLQTATSAINKSASRPAVWQVWARNAAGFAAAAALLLALLTNLPQSPAPMVVQTPPAQPTTSVPAPKPSAQPVAPVVAATAPARPMSFEALRHAAMVFTSPQASRPAPRPATVVAATYPATPSTPAPIVAPSPQPVVEPRPAPVVVAVSPARPEELPAPREVAVTLPARVETPVPTPVAPPEPSTPVRVAVIDSPRPTPAATVSPKPARRPSWVSRSASDEREVYSADRDETRLAEVRRDLDNDTRVIRDSQVKGFVIH